LENAVDEHSQTHSFNLTRSLGNMASLSNPALEGHTASGSLPSQSANDLCRAETGSAAWIYPA